jgi:hypothetical protein
LCCEQHSIRDLVAEPLTLTAVEKIALMRQRVTRERRLRADSLRMERLRQQYAQAEYLRRVREADEREALWMRQTLEADPWIRQITQALVLKRVAEISEMVAEANAPAPTTLQIEQPSVVQQAEKVAREVVLA